MKIISRSLIVSSLLFSVTPLFAAAPGGVDAGLTMWVKADTGLSCATEACQPTSWIDQVSGTSFAEQGATARLELKANNFNPAVNFGLNDHYRAAFDPVASTNNTFSFFSVGKRNSTDGDTWQCFFNASSNASWLGGGFGLCDGTGSNATMGFWTTDYTPNFVHTDAPNNVATPTILSGVYDGAAGNGQEMQYFTNHFLRGTQSYTGAIGDAGDTFLGAGSDAIYEFNGNMSETIIYDRPLSEVERLRVDSYMSLKYGINLEGATTYVNSNADVVYDLSANGLFVNSVAGIAYDVS